MFILWAADIPFRYSTINQLPPVVIHLCWAIQAAIVLAGTRGSGKIYKSIDNGLTWSQVYDSPETFIYTLNTLGNGVVLAGTGENGNVYRSLD